MRYFPQLINLNRLKTLKKIKWVFLIVSALVSFGFLILPHTWFPAIIQPDFQVFIEQVKPNWSLPSEYRDTKDLLKLDKSLQVADSKGKSLLMNHEIYEIMVATSSATTYFNQLSGNTRAISFWTKCEIVCRLSISLTMD
jgi:hypothetical protein